MNILFDAKFTTQYPDWLEGLELDGYNEDLCIAFEYDGIQHLKFVRHFHRTKKGFNDQIERDTRKDRLCGENILIRVSYTVKYEDIREYICAKCDGFGLKIPNNDDIDYRDFKHIYTNYEAYDRLKSMVEDKGCELISDCYVGANEKVIVKCNNGHEIQKTYNIMRRDTKCYKCMKNAIGSIQNIREIASDGDIECLSRKYVNRDTPLKFMCGNNHIFSMLPDTIYRNDYIHCNKCIHNTKYMNKIINIVKRNDGDCLDTKYPGSIHAKISLKCKNGHLFSSTLGCLSRGNWCHACKTGKHSIETMQELAAKYDGECLSTEYVNRIIKLKWRCKDGHEFIKAPSNIISKKVFCFECYKNERYG